MIAGFELEPYGAVAQKFPEAFDVAPDHRFAHPHCFQRLQGRDRCGNAGTMARVDENVHDGVVLEDLPVWDPAHQDHRVFEPELRDPPAYCFLLLPSTHEYQRRTAHDLADLSHRLQKTIESLPSKE